MTALAPAAAPALVAAAALALVTGPAFRARRPPCRSTGGGSAGVGPAGVRPSGGGRGWTVLRSRRLGGSAAAALAVSVTVGGPVGIFAGLTAAAVSYHLLGRLADPAILRSREAALRDLPLALDLLGSALRAGQPANAAAACVSEALPGPVGGALGAVARASSLGSAPDAAWSPLAQFAGAAAVARVAARAAESGTRLADELARLADDIRDRRAAAAQGRVRRAGVLVVLPLGLCFLPAFVLVGVVPVVVGLAGSLLH